MVDIVDSADAVLQIDIRRNSRNNIVNRNVRVVELFDYGLDYLFVIVGQRRAALQNFVEFLAGGNKFYAQLSALFSVLSVLGLLVVAFGRFGGIEYCVDFVAEFFSTLSSLQLSASFCINLKLGR